MSAKVFIIRTEYGYAVTPSPVVVPKGQTKVVFENLAKVKAKVSIPIPDEKPLEFELKPDEEPRSVTLPDTPRVVPYTVKMKGGLFARGNSAPIIIRDA